MQKSVIESLRESERSAWETYVQHQFVNELGDSTLPRDAFLHYLKQDYVFLIHFARAWAMAVVKSDRIGEMRTAAATVHALIDEEMRLHVKICAAEGITEETLEATVEESENLVYTRFVMDVGLRGDLLDLLVALAPCVFGYGEIGLSLLPRAEKMKHGDAYRNWIETYASSEYQDVCKAVSSMMDNVFARLIGGEIRQSPRYVELCRTFRIACELEAGFWGLAYKPEVLSG